MRISIKTKLNVILIAFCFPIAVLLYLLVSEKNIAINFGQKEIYGNYYLVPLSSLMEHIPEHSKLTIRQKSQESDLAPQITGLEQKIEIDLKELERVDKNHGAIFKETTEKLNLIKTKWASLKNEVGSLNISQSYDAYKKYLEELRSLIVYIGNESNLILDPDLDTYYLMDATLNKFPSKVVLLNQLHELSERVIINNMMSPDDKTQIVVIIGLLTSLTSDIKLDHKMAYDNTNDPTLKSETESYLTISQTLSQNLFKLIDKNLLKDNNLKLFSSRFETDFNKTLKASFATWDASLKAENRFLQNRIDKLTRSKKNSIILSLAVAFVLLGFGAYLIMHIVKSIKMLEDGAKKVAEGDLNVKVKLDSKDELESLSDSFNKMVENVKDSLELSEKNTINLETLIKETSTTVSQIKQTAEIVSDNARIVAEAAALSVNISNEGEKAVSDSIDGVDRIKEQIEAIAQKILELSSQTQTIGKIISTVDDLSRQSKILAFNASIEASKAGEYGKGFSVVSNEIKNLSEESKEATKKISEILGEIQQLTNTAVMMTEEGTKLADKGVNLSKIAGVTINKLALSIQNSSEAVYQISSSAIEQRTGMEQLEESMKSISFLGRN